MSVDRTIGRVTLRTDSDHDVIFAGDPAAVLLGRIIIDKRDRDVIPDLYEAIARLAHKHGLALPALIFPEGILSVNWRPASGD